MIEETNSFQIDVKAEEQAFGPILTPSTIQTPQFESQTSEQPLPESLKLDASEFLKLPDPIIIEPKDLNLSSSAIAEVSKTIIDMEVKFDAEESYKNLYNQVNNMQDTLESAVNNITNTWIPNPKPASKFEERPSLDPTNVIFEARRARFSQYPHWA